MIDIKDFVTVSQRSTGARLPAPTEEDIFQDASSRIARVCREAKRHPFVLLHKLLQNPGRSTYGYKTELLLDLEPHNNLQTMRLLGGKSVELDNKWYELAQGAIIAAAQGFGWQEDEFEEHLEDTIYGPLWNSALRVACIFEQRRYPTLVPRLYIQRDITRGTEAGKVFKVSWWAMERPAPTEILPRISLVI